MRFPPAILLLALTGCASSSLPRLPAWQMPETLRRVESAEVCQAISAYAPEARVELSDGLFVTVSHEWALDLVKWSREAITVLTWHTDTGRLYSAETFDCDKFAKAFSLAAELSAGRKIAGAQVLVGRIYVDQVEPFGRIPAGGGHALNFFVSDRGIFVVEPQSGVSCPLAEYPNRSNITAVKIGG